jgi:hypothetical protein
MYKHDLTKVITDQTTNTINTLLQYGQQRVKEMFFNAVKCPVSPHSHEKNSWNFQTEISLKKG